MELTAAIGHAFTPNVLGTTFRSRHPDSQRETQSFTTSSLLCHMKARATKGNWGLQTIAVNPFRMLYMKYTGKPLPCFKSTRNFRSRALPTRWVPDAPAWKVECAYLQVLCGQKRGENYAPFFFSFCGGDLLVSELLSNSPRAVSIVEPEERLALAVPGRLPLCNDGIWSNAKHREHPHTPESEVEVRVHFKLFRGDACFKVGLGDIQVKFVSGRSAELESGHCLLAATSQHHTPLKKMR